MCENNIFGTHVWSEVGEDPFVTGCLTVNSVRIFGPELAM